MPKRLCPYPSGDKNRRTKNPEPPVAGLESVSLAVGIREKKGICSPHWQYVATVQDRL
jgi:hypothetical protein